MCYISVKGDNLSCNVLFSKGFFILDVGKITKRRG